MGRSKKKEDSKNDSGYIHNCGIVLFAELVRQKLPYASKETTMNLSSKKAASSASITGFLARFSRF